LISIGFSLGLHLVTVTVLSVQARFAPAKPQPVKIRILEKKAEPKIAEVPKPPPKPPAPPKPKPKQKTATDRPKPIDRSLPPPKPIQGLTADAMSKGGKVAVPLGNTLMTGDTGERPRVAPAAFDGDLTSDARLIGDSIVKPEYTDAAVEANLNGQVLVEVQVDEAGKVVDASLKRKVGFGMDERILGSIRSARFVPRKDRYGKAEAGWTEIKFNLQLP
jgi:protein TonB